MKAYIVNISFQYIEPKIWRRVILPAGCTFNRLHEIIQSVTNFQDYHSFAFEIEGNFITNNGAILAEYKGRTYAGGKVKSPTRMKIDNYLEKHRKLVYEYDFGDSWLFDVELENVVDDYYFGYPTILAGEGNAPPEDVGGPPGYEEFLTVYHDPAHPDYIHHYAWAEQQFYLPLDIEETNEALKQVKYQKTEWEHIDHDRFFVLSDKYRGSDYVDIESIANVERVVQYAVACTNLYGTISYPNFLEIYNSHNEPPVTSKELKGIFTHPLYIRELEAKEVEAYEEGLFHKEMDLLNDYDEFIHTITGKPFYVPNQEELLRYTKKGYYEKTPAQGELAKKMAKDFYGGSPLLIQLEIDKLVLELAAAQADFNKIVQGFLQRHVCNDLTEVNEYTKVITKIGNTTRIWENRGHTPHELAQKELSHFKPLPKEAVRVTTGAKVGRNDSCPCGSGKKFKKCCGR